MLDFEFSYHFCHFLALTWE